MSRSQVLVAANAKRNKRTATAPKDPSDLDALVGRRHWVRAGLSDFGTNISGGLRAVMVAVPTESRASKAPLRRNPNTNRTSGSVPVSTAVLAAIMSAILTVALCESCFIVLFQQSN